ncbi:hypothetical protein [Chelativorans salis]|uniref:Uncharacterized protein n=1 Tax=Chelativorans salis TaxID=2978478 RepID=A0ABT2LRI2_9HYPH|nr:hypothetical protein [Chelativorans sp. EGI FJ00035]MCT7377160.1 hypothetical protein [Chelativorans sp. EGI FJ00035]
MPAVSGREPEPRYIRVSKDGFLFIALKVKIAVKDDICDVTEGTDASTLNPSINVIAGGVYARQEIKSDTVWRPALDR